MNITVTGNITVSVELEVIVPTEETFLINKNIEANDILYGAEYNLGGGYLKISYSQSINQKIPNVTDY